MNTLGKLLSGIIVTIALLLPAQGAGATSAANGADLGLASSLIATGGGAGSFSTIRAFDRMVGPDTTLSLENRLATAEGQGNANQFVSMFDYAINDAWRLAGVNNVSMPSATENGGVGLAQQLVQAGTVNNGTFSGSIFFQNLFGSTIASEIMADLNQHFGPGSSVQFDRMSGQFFHDLTSSSS